MTDNTSTPDDGEDEDAAAVRDRVNHLLDHETVWVQSLGKFMVQTSRVRYELDNPALPHKPYVMPGMTEKDPGE